MTNNTHYHCHCFDGQVHQDQREARSSPDHQHAHHDKHQDHHPQHILSARTKDKLDLDQTITMPIIINTWITILSIYITYIYIVYQDQGQT